jgi:hypothetical protein
MRQGPDQARMARPRADFNGVKMLTTQSPEAQQFMRERDGKMALNIAEAERRIHPYNPATSVLHDGAWAGQTCFIIGGGPSLLGFDFERLRGKGRIIVINKGYMSVPFADVLFFMDHASFYAKIKRGTFGQEAITAWAEFPGLKVFLNLMGRKVEDAYSIKSLGQKGLSSSIECGLFHGNNSGYGAIGLAVCLGANPIYLLGYDCKFKNGVSHWHGGYNYRQPESIFRSFKDDIDSLGKLIAAKGTTRIVNLNPDSALTSFPKSTIEKVLM